jgi:hypothetical protein
MPSRDGGLGDVAIVCARPRELDPLGFEMVKWAMQGVVNVIQTGSTSADLDIDAERELASPRVGGDGSRKWCERCRCLARHIDGRDAR